jgi:hypothetical protein
VLRPIGLASLALLAGGAAPQDPSLEPVRRALALTGEAPYAFRVLGRFERSGVYAPGPLVSSVMKTYRSIRHGERMLVKGPEGLWKTPEERLGEQVERPDPEAADIVRTLQGADAPHRLLEAVLEEVAKSQPPDEREVGGVPCLRYLMHFKGAALRTSLEKQIARAVERGTLTRPDEIRWSSSMKGSLRLYVHKKEGRLLKAVDDRSVKLAYKVPDGPPEIRSYRTEMEFVVENWGQAEPEVPPELRERLGLGD